MSINFERHINSKDTNTYFERDTLKEHKFARQLYDLVS